MGVDCTPGVNRRDQRHACLDIPYQNARRPAIEDVDVSIVRGNPDRSHELLTRPRVTRHLSDGKYSAYVMKFNMVGDWRLIFATVAA